MPEPPHPATLRHIKHALIRSDCDLNMGVGHAMRCLALGAALRDAGVAVRFAMADCLDETAERYAAESFAIERVAAERGSTEDAELTSRAARDAGAELVVLDGYQFGPAYQRVVRRAAVLAVIDDTGSEADAVIAPAPPVRPELYDPALSRARLLLGPEYLLLRPEFDGWAGWRRVIDGPARRMMVAIGGTDPLNMTDVTLAALDRIPGKLEIVVATTVADRRRALSARLGAREAHGPHDIRVEQGVADMASLMAWADIGVIGGGTTLWEAAYMGLPVLALIVADNQVPGAACFEQAGCGIVQDSRASPVRDALTRHLSDLIAGADIRAGFRDRGQALVDGNGGRRLVAALDAIVGEEAGKRRRPPDGPARKAGRPAGVSEI